MIARWSTVRRGSWSSGALRGAEHEPQHLDVACRVGARVPVQRDLRGGGVRVAGRELPASRALAAAGLELWGIGASLVFDQGSSTSHSR